MTSVVSHPDTWFTHEPSPAWARPQITHGDIGMRHSFVILLLISCVTLPLSAQSPQGWKMRVDRSQNAQDPDDRPDLAFKTMGKGFHVKGGPAGTFWNASNNAAGNYTLKATFNLNEPSSHPISTVSSSGAHSWMWLVRPTPISWSRRTVRS